MQDARVKPLFRLCLHLPSLFSWTKTLIPSFEVKEAIRNQIDIVDLVSEHIPLQRKGRIYIGRCPWHDDKRPSLQVNPDRQTYRCWVCDIGGDIFSFVQRIEGVDFKEALELLADKAGIPLPKPAPRSRRTSLLPGTSFSADGSPETAIPGGSVSKATLYKTLEWLCEKYHQYYLTSSEAENARSYIQERGISEQSARKFKIGYAPMRTSVLLDWINNSRIGVQTLIAAGVLDVSQNSPISQIDIFSGDSKTISNRERSAIYDRCHGRVLFPIRDPSKRTVAFGGRILPNSTLNSSAKYLNSSESIVFSKKKMFYGFDMANNHIRAKRRAIITEGYTDTIMAHQYGFEETVAVLGVGVGEEHVKKLDQLAPKIYLVLDGDSAGRKRANEVLSLFIARGADMSILTLPDNNDPCEFLLAHGKEAFEELLENHAVGALDHAFDQAVEGIDLSNIIESSRALDSLLKIIALAPLITNVNDPAQIRISQVLQRLAEKFRMSRDEINKRLEVLRNDPARNRHQADQSNHSSPIAKANIVPIPQFDDETPEELALRFGSIPPDILENPSFAPKAFEIEFFTFWWTCPELFSELAAQVTADDFLSPISRQIFLLGTDLLRRGVVPVTFETILSRYDSPAMIARIDDIAEQGSAKNLRNRLAKETNRKVLLNQILDAFLNERIKRVKSNRVSDLQGDELDQQNKVKSLLELQKLLKEKQARHNEQEKSALMDEDTPGTADF